MSTSILEDRPDVTHVRVTFHPQIWHNEHAVTSDDTVTFLVPIEKALTLDGKIVADDTDASDQLAWVEEAPDLAQNWSGPFYVTVDELVSDPKTKREESA
jgi:hypothetical protein